MLFQIRRCIYHPLAAHRLLPVPAPKLRVHTYSEKWRRSPHTAECGGCRSVRGTRGRLGSFLPRFPRAVASSRVLLIPAPRGAENPPLLRVPVCPTAFKDANPATVRGRVSATLTRRNRSLEIPQASWGFRVYVSGSRHTWALPASYPRPSTAEGRSG